MIRLYLIKKYKIQGRYPFIVRGNLIIGWAIIATLLTDSIAVIITKIHFPLSNAIAILYSGMLVLIILSILILVISYNTRKILVAEKVKSSNSNNELDRVYNIKFLKPINPGIHPIKFSVFISVLTGILLCLVELVGEGPAPTFLRTILTFSAYLLIEGIGVFLLLIIIGPYLGVLGEIKKYLSAIGNQPNYSK